MRRLAPFVLALALAAASACGSEPSRESPAGGRAGSGSGSSTVATPADAGPPPEEAIAAPHGGSIVAVALTDAGDAALTADSFGLLRLWPSLAGDREPLVVRGGPARQLALGRDRGALVAALLDPAGGVELLRFDAAGAVIGRARAHAEPGFEELAFAGGAVLARTSDHAIAALDLRGGLSGRIVAGPGERILSLVVRGRAAVAAIATDEAAAARSVRRIELAGGLRWGDTLALPDPLTPPFALSPGGAHLAGFDAKPALQVLELAPRPRAVGTQDSGRPRGIGFLDPQTVVSSDGLLFSLGEAPPDRPPLEVRNANGIVAIADGVVAGGHGGSLLLAGTGGTTFLGYRHAAVGVLRRAHERLVLSAGRRALWLDERLEIAREVTGEQTLAYDLLLDDTHVLELHVGPEVDGAFPERVLLADHASGRRGPLTPDPGPFVAYHAGTRTLATRGRDGEVRRWRLELATGAVERAGRALRARPDSFVKLFDPAEVGGVVAIAYQEIDEVLHVEWFTEAGAGAGSGPAGKPLVPSARLALPRTSAIDIDAGGTLWTLARSKVRQVTRYRQGRLVGKFTVPEAITGGAIDPAGQRLVASDGRALVAFDEGGKEQWRTWAVGSVGLMFSARGDRLFVAGQGGLVALDAATGRQVAARCGWGFGRAKEEASSMLGAAPVCAEGRTPR